MESLRVVHLHTLGGIGGAFIAADRLHQSLLKQQIESMFLYGRSLDKQGVFLNPTQYYQPLPLPTFREKSLVRLAKRVGLNDLGHTSTFSLQQHPAIHTASVLNFHNLHSDYFSYLALPKLTRYKPAIWTLHDMWSFTGHCAYSYDCEKWQVGCGQCPYPDTPPGVRQDATALEWQLKRWLYQHSNLTIVTPSRWLAEQAQQSILKRFPIYHIPNGIDTTIYQPLDSQQCRAKLGIPADKNVLLFSAQSLSDARKGGDLLQQALSQLPSTLKSKTILITLGGSDRQVSATADIPTIHLGYVNTDSDKAIVYSAADIFVFPTRADNLPLVLQESLACGTPMVSFKVGGVPDIVRSDVTGYLAAPEDEIDLCNGIVHLLENSELRHTLKQNCRAIATQEYCLNRQAARYIELYRQICQSSQRVS